MNAMEFESGRVALAAGAYSCTDKEWNAHPSCAGVRLKHLVAGEHTGQALSCHLVCLEPGASLSLHTHDPQWELHEVLEGAGEMLLDGKEIPYAPGAMSVIPRGCPHELRAGDNGLVLLAKFFPPLR